jgi:thiamine pyrophosphokinase
MRGIAFIGGEGPGPEQCRRLGFPGGDAAYSGGILIVAADSGLIAAEAAGIRPRWIIGDMDSLDDPRRLDKYLPEALIRHPHEKDLTDTELALRLLRERGCGEIWLLGGGGGRTDHLLAVQALFEREEAPDRWITAAEDIRFLGEGRELILQSAGWVSVFPLGRGPWKVESRGLKWPLDDLSWKRGFFSISNEAPETVFSLKAVRGAFLVFIPLA